MPPSRAADGPLLFLVAGEPSGDQIGAHLMAALKAESGGRIRFVGVGGERMTAEGLESLFPVSELAVMGIVEIVPHVLRILRRIRQTAAAARAAGPDAVITIDSPSFTLEVSKRLKNLDVPLVHYVAPTVWAWKSWRAKDIAGYVDHLLALFPFEPPYFEKYGLATTVVGHPAVETTAAALELDAQGFRQRLGFRADVPTLCLLPGSRRGEVGRLLPVFREAVGHLEERLGSLQVVLPTVSTVAAEVAAAVSEWPQHVAVVTGPHDKYAAFAVADAALAASGTVAVELAVAGVPSVITYKVTAVSAALARRLLKVRYASIMNLMLDAEVQPELLQENCTPERLSDEAFRLLSDRAAARAQIERLRPALKQLGLGGTPPSRLAAQVILKLTGAATISREGSHA